MRCADVLGGSDLSIAVIDKSRTPGVKPCAGGITPNTELYHELPGKYLQFYRHRVIINRREFDVALKHPIRVVDREELAGYQIDRINRHDNIRLFRGVSVESISSGDGKNYVSTREGQRFGYRYLVGADGSNSVTRAFLGLEFRSRIGFNYRIRSEHDGMAWYFNPNLLGDGYCWIFPHLDFLSCGVYYDPRAIEGKEAKKALNRFLDSRGLKYDKNELKGFPVNCSYSGYSFGNIFLCGDAAGVALPATGEGIYPAVQSGESVGKFLLGDRSAFSAMDTLQRACRSQNRAVRLFRYMRSAFIQSFGLEVLARLGSRYYKS